MIADYDWDEILDCIKQFSKVEDISDIIIVGRDDGIRRISIKDVEVPGRD